MGASPCYIELAELLIEPPRNGLYKGKDYQGSGNRWIKMSNIFGGSFFKNAETELLRVTQSEIDRFSCRSGDLLFGRTSLVLEGVGDCLLIRDVDDQPIFESNLFRLRLDESRAHPLFYYYFFKSVHGRQLIQRIAKQTAAASITAGDLIAEPVPCPPLETQKRIADLLFCFDQKIELNRQANQTLESMAQALFKSWFVDFDPVIDNALAAGHEIPEPLAAKAAARSAFREQDADKANQPHVLSDHIRQLFPSGFQFTEVLGWIPEGWSVQPFRTVARHVRDSASAQNINPSEVYVGLEHIGRKQLFLENSGFGSDVESNKSRFQKGDVLFGKLRPYFHKVALTDTNGICSTDILVFRAEDAAYQAFMALTAYREDFVAHANACSSGTRMPRANAKDLLEYQVAMPTRDLAQQLQATVAPMWEKAHANLLENSSLAKIRDALLPKLLSGELRIPEAEKMLDEAIA